MVSDQSRGARSRWPCCSAIVSSDIAAARAKNGAARKRSMRVIRPRFHHAISKSTNGRTTVEGLLNSAAAQQSNDKAYQTRCECLSNWRKHSSVRKKKLPDWMFFNSVAQATDSTLTGCTAHNAA